jgi:hypothetical protein
MKHIKPQSRPSYANIGKLDEIIIVDPCEDLVGLALIKCRKRESLD